LRAVIDAVSDPIYCKDHDGRYLLANRAHSARMNIPHQQQLGKTVFEIPEIGELADRFYQEDLQVLTTGRSIVNQEQYVHWLDGSCGWYLTSKYPLRNAAGETIGIVGVGRDVSERRDAERKLHDERQMLRTVIDAVADSIFFKDQQGRFVLVNAAYETLFGLPSEKVVGHTDRDIAAMRAYAEEYAADDRHVLSTGLPVINREEPIPQPDGSDGWFLTSKFPLRNTDGIVIGLVGIARDITAMRRATEELASAQNRLADHVENSPLAIIEWQADFRVERWSGRAEPLFGWRAEEVIGKHLSDWPFVHPNDLETVRIAVTRLINGQDQRNVCLNRNLTRDGRVVYCVWHNSALRDSKGRIVSMLSLVEDVTERVEAETAVQESQRLYHTLIEATETGYAVIDDRGQVLQANAEFVRLTGRPSLDEILGRSVIDWTAPHDHLRNAQAVAACVATGFTRNFETDYLWPDGHILPIEVNARMIATSRGRQIIALCRDITDRRAAERERQEIQRKVQETQKLESLGVLAGGIAHDFNNLLTSILGNAALAALDLPSTSPILGQIRQIETAATRAAELCKQMLAYSGKGRFIIRRLDVNAVIAETTDLFQVSISKKAALSLDLATALPAVEGDATQIRQIVMNLVINASEALGEAGGSVRVSTGVVRADAAYLATAHLPTELAEGNYVYLAVTDTGCGMTPEVRSRIFDPFFTTKFAGRGLGLAAVLGIVRGHRGAMCIESEPGCGSTFRVLLPALAVPAEVEPPPPPPASGWRGGGTALIIDDEPAVRSTATQMLRALGFEVKTAYDGVEGVAAFNADPDLFSLVLLDLTMPRLDGAGVLLKLRELRPDVRVVMMSGYNESELVTRLSADGPAAFLQKPFRFNTLREKLQIALA